MRARHRLAIVCGALTLFSSLGPACTVRNEEGAGTLDPFATEPGRFFPMSVGLRWEYVITIGATDPVTYSYVRWPVGENRRQGFSNRGAFQALLGGSNEGKQFMLAIGVSGVARAQGEFERLRGVELSIEKDELGVFKAHKGVFWAANGQGWAQAVGEERRFMVEQIVTYSSDEPGAPASGMISPPPADGNTVQLFFFADAAGTEIGPEGVDEVLRFVGVESQVWNTSPVSTMHFMRRVSPAADQPDFGPRDIVQGNLSKGFTEDLWFGADLGLIRLIQKVGERVSMTWELTAASGR